MRSSAFLLRTFLLLLLLAADAALILLLHVYRGTTVITPSAIDTPGIRSDSASFASSANSTDWYKLEIKKLTQVVQTASPKEALAVLRTDMNADGRVLRLCHALAHEIGHAAYEKTNSFTGSLLFENDICGSGYLHGVVETHFAKVGNIEQTMRIICKPGDASCFHGVGHGLMFFLDNNVVQSIKLCQTYAEPFQKIQCAEGVYMENYNTDFKAHPSEYLKAEDPFYPCADQPELLKPVCYFYAPRFYLRIHTDAFEDALKWCDGAEEKYRDACAKGVGSATMKFTIKDPALVERVCSSHTPDMEPYCIDGMSSYYLVNFASLSKTRALCKELQPEHYARCMKTVTGGERFFGE
ncbi:MAG: hypothetical protein JWM56_445 [Candidatus Peribacteria bacterium]|nr:hypothetical protein [Candidatus Peribacteria bacterium]